MKLDVRFIALGLGLAFLAEACSHHKVTLAPESTTGGKTGILTFNRVELKDKKRKFDVLTEVRNESTKPILFFVEDLKCSRGGTEGILQSTDAMIFLHAGESRGTRYTCELPARTMGEFKLNVSKVYDNPSGDGRTPGKTIANDVTWTAPDPAANVKKL